MRKVKLISVLLLSCFGLWFCQKKLFGHVEVKGRLLHFFTNQPLQKSVELRGDDATSSKNSTENSISLCKGQSNEDGTFDIRSKPSRRDRYYLYIDGKSWNEKKTSEIDVTANKTNDLGDIFIGTQTFYCRITIHGTSDSSITFYPTIYNGQFFAFNSGTSTQFLQSVTYYKDDYEDNNHNFYIYYEKANGGNRTWWEVTVPINNTDTLGITINY